MASDLGLNDLSCPHLLMGKVGRCVGLKGFMAIASYADPPECLAQYLPWLIKKEGELEEHRPEMLIVGGKLRARFAGLANKTNAEDWVGKPIYVAKTNLPALNEDSYYWYQLLTLEVFNQGRESLGSVAQIYDTGVNLVLVVKNRSREHWIPFYEPYLVRVDLIAQKIIVNWESNF